MKNFDLIKRFFLFILGLFVMGFGVGITKFASLGVTPIASVPNVFSIKLSEISLGNFLILWNILLIAGQVLILRRDFKLYQLIQIPMSFLFGYFTDLSLVFLSRFEITSYFHSLLSLAIGIIFLSLGISITIIADVILNSGEAFVKAISDKHDLNFGNVKVIFDTSCVVSSIIFSLIFFGKIEGTREGTLISALITGFVVNIILRIIRKPIEAILKIGN